MSDFPGIARGLLGKPHSNPRRPVMLQVSLAFVWCLPFDCKAIDATHLRLLVVLEVTSILCYVQVGVPKKHVAQNIDPRQVLRNPATVQ